MAPLNSTFAVRKQEKGKEERKGARVEEQYYSIFFLFSFLQILVPAPIVLFSYFPFWKLLGRAPCSGTLTMSKIRRVSDSGFREAHAHAKGIRARDPGQRRRVGQGAGKEGTVGELSAKRSKGPEVMDSSRWLLAVARLHCRTYIFLLCFLWACTEL